MIKITPQKLVVATGESAFFLCCTIIPGSLTWSHNSRIVSQEKSKVSLLISNVTERDAGIYSCALEDSRKNIHRDSAVLFPGGRKSTKIYA